MWDVSDFAPVYRVGISAGLYSVTSIAFSPDGKRFATANWHGDIALRDTRTGDLLHTFQQHSERVYSISFSDDGSRIAAGGQDHRLAVWDATSYELIKVLEYPLPISVALFRPGGGSDTLLFRWGTNDLRLFSIETEEFSTAFPGMDGLLSDAQYSNDGSLVVALSYSDTAYIWNANTAELLLKTGQHGGQLRFATLSPDNKRLATAGEDGNVKIWTLDANSAVQPLRPREVPNNAESVYLWPNPSQSVVDVRYTLKAASTIRICIVDMLGREITVINDGTRAAGTHAIHLNVSELPTGSYRCLVQTENGVAHQQLVVRH
jgi:WD40 repeat protein